MLSAAIFAGLWLGSLSNLAQAIPRAPAEIEIRDILQQFYAARLAGEKERSLGYLTPDATLYYPNGSTGSLVQRITQTLGLPVTELTRQVQLLSPSSALAVTIWRVPKNQPPIDAGTRDIFLVRDARGWKIAGWRAFPLDSMKSVALEPGELFPENTLSPAESAQGWRALFDGRSINGWVTMAGRAQLPASWRIDSGALVTVPGSPAISLRTRSEFETFEFAFEWLVTARANSGVKYRLFANELWEYKGTNGDGIGFEYQVADDDGDPGARRDFSQKSGSLYGVVPVSRATARPPGQWNESKIVVTHSQTEHWLNGEKVATHPIDVSFPSPIVLQHHNSEVRFRKLRVRALPR